jgi:hypothetical protein
MPHYRPAGQDFHFPGSIPELEPFETTQSKLPATGSFVHPSFLENELISRTEGWVGGTYRQVETWSTPPGILLKVAGGSDFHISSGGQAIVCAEGITPPMTGLDREILVGPALVVALALRGTWCLHASAIMQSDRAMLFLGESGQGKSTLAAYLAADHHFRLVADDILPVITSETGLTVWPHFPQLKLPMDSQPGVSLPEKIPAGWICLLADTDIASNPTLNLLSPSQATQTLLRHTAGTRLLEPELLAKHLEFCAQAARQIPVYELSYPHRKDALPEIKQVLTNLC